MSTMSECFWSDTVVEDSTRLTVHPHNGMSYGLVFPVPVIVGMPPLCDGKFDLARFGGFVWLFRRIEQLPVELEVWATLPCQMLEPP